MLYRIIVSGLTSALALTGLVSGSTAQAQDLVWVRQAGGPGANVIGLEIAVDNDGNVHSAGALDGTADFDPGPGVLNLTSPAGYAIYVQKLDSTGKLIWAGRMGGGGLFDVADGLAVDSSGNVYVAGRFEGTVDFDIGPGVFELTAVGGWDAFVQKLDSEGHLVWAKQFGGTNAGQDSESALDVKVDGDGNVYSTGVFFGIVDFDPGPGVFNLTSTGSADTFISKLDSGGNLVWVKQFSGAGEVTGTGIAVDGGGNVHVAGAFFGNADFDPGPGVANLFSPAGRDIFVVKLDASGGLLWAKTMGGLGWNLVRNIALGADGAVYTTGSFAETIDFDPGPGVFNLTTTGVSDWDAFVSKLNSDGDFVWASGMGGADFESGYALAVHEDGNVSATGWFQGTVDFDPGAGAFNLTSAGGRDVFVLTVAPNGGFVSAQSVGGSGDDIGRAVALDSDGSLHATGVFEGVADFDPGPGIFNLTASGTTDSFVLKLGSATVVAQQKTAEIVQRILDLNLHEGIENSLDAKLSSALNALDDMNDNNNAAAVNSLEAAINAIEAQRDNKISSADADELIAAIQAVIDLLSSVI